MNRKILITGTSSGIGKATSLLLLEKGYSIVGISRSPSAFEHKNFSHFSGDLSHIEELFSLCKKIGQAHPDIDGIICNAGQGYFGHLEELSFEKIREIVDLNFLSPLLLVRHFFPLFKKAKKGDVILIGSEAADKGKKQNSIYGATKAAIKSFAKTLREEGRSSNIKVHLITPAIVRTAFYDALSFTPSSKEEAALDASDIAEVILFILQLAPRVVFDEILLSSLKKEICFSKQSAP